jgi:hypothetical protein
MVAVKVNTISTSTTNNVAMQCALNLKNLSSDPGSGNTAGDLYYNTTTNKVRFYSSSWNDL